MFSKKRLFLTLFLVVALIFSIAACNGGLLDGGNNNGNNNDGEQTQTDIPKPEVPETEAPAVEFPEADEEELIGNADYDEAKAVIILKTNTAEITGTGASVTTGKEYSVYDADGVKTDAKTTYGTVVEISESGTYVLEGTLNPGFVAVSKKELTVKLILNGVNIYCENYAAILCLKKSDVTVELAEGSTNYLTDGGAGGADGKYDYAYDNEEQPNAALLIRKDLTICGEGKLIVNGGLNNGIGTRANLTITGGDITSYAVNNAIKGNDSISISGGKFTLVSQSDGVKTESVDDGLGFIDISGGEFLITSVNDAIQASTTLTVSNAVMKMKTGGGYNIAAKDASAKGLKAETDLTVNSGTFEIDSNDDALHSNGDITVQGSTITAATADDGIHADNNVTVNGGTINISKSYEGIEGLNVNINGGIIRIKSSDDGINISGGADGSATQPGRPGAGGRPGGGFGAIDGALTITGGEVFVDSAGDGLDSNGNIAVSGGTVVVFGPTNSGDAPVDFDGSFTMTGGTLIALGSSGMAQQPGSSSTQYTFLAKLNAVKADTLLNVSAADGTEIVTVKTLKSTQSIVVCSPKLAKGSYKIYSGGSHSGTINDLNLYTGGAYTVGTTLKSFTINNMVTTVN